MTGHVLCARSHAADDGTGSDFDAIGRGVSRDARAAQFSKTVAAPAWGIPSRDRLRLEGGRRSIALGPQLVERSAGSQSAGCSLEAALTDAGAPARPARRRRSRAARRDRLAVEPDRHPGRSSAAPRWSQIPKASRDQPRQVDLGRRRAPTAGIVVGDLALAGGRCRSAASASAPAPSPWKRSTSRRASSRLASPGCRPGSSSSPSSRLQ